MSTWHWTHQFEEALQYIREEALAVRTKPAYPPNSIGKYACLLARQDHAVCPIVEHGDSPAEAIVNAYNEWRRLGL